MIDDELVTSGQDQPIPFDPEPVMRQMDKIVDGAIEKRDINIAVSVARDLVQASRVSGIALARILFRIKQAWEEFELDMDFEDYLFMETGLSKVSIQRYCYVGAMEVNTSIDNDIRQKLLQRPMKDLIPIATALASGHKFEDEHWKELVNARDNSTVQEIMRDVRQAPPRSTYLSIRMSRDGVLRAYSINNPNGIYIGDLEVRGREDSDDVEKAITRIINSAGIQLE